MEITISKFGSGSNDALRNCLTENASMNLRKASSTANCILGRVNHVGKILIPPPRFLRFFIEVASTVFIKCVRPQF